VKAGERLVEWTARNTVERWFGGKDASDAIKQVGRIPAVIVRQSDDLSSYMAQAYVPGHRQAARRSRVYDRDSSDVFGKNRQKPVVGVLVDDD
jgi:hypothetical protein